jgi:hypothetical protein
VVTESGTCPPPLRVVLRDLQADLDQAAADHLAHRGEHGCREGSGCEEGERLSAISAAAQGQLGMTRFVNND